MSHTIYRTSCADRSSRWPYSVAAHCRHHAHATMHQQQAAWCHDSHPTPGYPLHMHMHVASNTVHTIRPLVSTFSDHAWWLIPYTSRYKLLSNGNNCPLTRFTSCQQCSSMDLRACCQQCSSMHLRACCQQCSNMHLRACCQRRHTRASAVVPCCQAQASAAVL